MAPPTTSSTASTSSMHEVLDSDTALVPPRPSFLAPNNRRSSDGPEEPSSSSPRSGKEKEKEPASPTSPRRPTTGTTASRPTTGSVSVDGSNTGDPFATPTAEQTNPFSPPASVLSFSMGDTPVGNAGPGGYPFPANSALSSMRNSAVDLAPQMHSRRASRAALASPPRRPLTIIQPSIAAASSGTGVGSGPRVRPSKKPRPASTMLTGEIYKPWAEKKDSTMRVAYWLFYGVMLLGVAGSVLRCYFGWKGVQLLGNLCLVMDEDFDSGELDTENTWSREADMSGFGNGEFEMTTVSSNNSFIRNNQLYILPTLTSDVIGNDAIYDGHTFNLTGCTNTNLTACGAVSNRTAGTIINPVMSARLTTKGKKSIRYGRVEVRAKLPRGDWMWPAIWMLPEDNKYGPWPLSGEIDIMESRGNGISYPAQGVNYVRGSLNWGPLSWLNAVSKTFGWWTLRRTSYDKAFHTYALEWSPDFLRIYVDSRLSHMLELKFNIPFFQRGDFPAAVSNASQEIILENPWAGSGNSAPFDQPFFLILNVAIGGTNGWWPDNVGKKPWLNGALNAMEQFALAQDQWYPTWAQSDEDRAMVVDYVKMWELC